MAHEFPSSKAAVAFAALCTLAGTAPVAAQSQLGRIEIGRPFPDEKFTALRDGRSASLADFRGKRVLLLVFASW